MVPHLISFFIKFWILILSPRSALFPCLMWRRKIFSTEKKRDYCQGSTDRWHSPLLLSSWFFWPREIWPVGKSLTPVCGSLTIAKNMQKLLGKINGPKNIRHTPTIAVIGSGGGFRAMTGTGIHELVPSSIRRSLDLWKRDGRCNESSSKYGNLGLLYLFGGFIRYWLNGIQNGVKKTKPHFTDLLTGLPPCKSWLTTWQISNLMSHKRWVIKSEKEVAGIYQHYMQIKMSVWLMSIKKFEIELFIIRPVSF